MFSSNSFIVSGLTFRSLMYFEFIFVYGVKRGHCIFLPPLSKIRYPQVHGFVSGLSILFHLSIFLFLCLYHTVLMTVALQYSLKSRSLIPPAPFFFLKIALAIQGLLCFHMNCEIFCSSSVKSAIGNLIGIALNLCIWQHTHFTILILPTQELEYLSSAYVIFDFFHQCLIIFCVQFFHHFR